MVSGQKTTDKQWTTIRYTENSLIDKVKKTASEQRVPSG
jgi:hypothetical protein